MSAAKTTTATLACSTDTDSLSSRLARIALLAQRPLQSERQDGRTLHLTYAQEAGPELRRILELGHQRCPFLVSVLKEEDGVIELAILAPDTDGLTATLYEHYRGVAPSHTTRACAGSGCGCVAQDRA